MIVSFVSTCTYPDLLRVRIDCFFIVAVSRCWLLRKDQRGLASFNFYILLFGLKNRLAFPWSRWVCPFELLCCSPALLGLHLTCLLLLFLLFALLFSSLLKQFRQMFWLKLQRRRAEVDKLNQLLYFRKNVFICHETVPGWKFTVLQVLCISFLDFIMFSLPVVNLSLLDTSCPFVRKISWLFFTHYLHYVLILFIEFPIQVLYSLAFLPVS